MEPDAAIPDGGRILVVDDEAVVADVLRRLLRKEVHRVEVASDAASARVLLESEATCDAVPLAVMLRVPDARQVLGAEGLRVLGWVGVRDPAVAVVMLPAFGSSENAVAARKLGAFASLTKPFKDAEVRHLVAQAVLTTRLRVENHDLRKALEERY